MTKLLTRKVKTGSPLVLFKNKKVMLTNGFNRLNGIQGSSLLTIHEISSTAKYEVKQPCLKKDIC